MAMKQVLKMAGIAVAIGMAALLVLTVGGIWFMYNFTSLLASPNAVPPEDLLRDNEVVALTTFSGRDTLVDLGRAAYWDRNDRFLVIEERFVVNQACKGVTVGDSISLWDIRESRDPTYELGNRKLLLYGNVLRNVNELPYIATTVSGKEVVDALLSGAPTVERYPRDSTLCRLVKSSDRFNDLFRRRADHSRVIYATDIGMLLFYGFRSGYVEYVVRFTPWWGRIVRDKPHEYWQKLLAAARAKR